MIKYLGSKRLLAPVLGDIAEAIGALTAVDLFTGTTRVAQEFKRRGLHVIASDVATYSHVLAQCFVGTDAADVDAVELAAVLHELQGLPGRRGYVTETFCERSRYFHPDNGVRIDAMREHLDARYREHPLFAVLLTALMLAADRVDSTTGVQMAYLKRWAPRALRPLELRPPDLLAGRGVALRADALRLVDELPDVDLAYLDPPYNQHRYFANYHVWETLVRWDGPEHYGIACKRADARDEATKSPFNRRHEMPGALRSVIHRTRAKIVIVSYNDESWVAPPDIATWLGEAGHETVGVLAFDARRYVGAQIGVFNPQGRKVGTVSHLRNTEYLFVAGPTDLVAAATARAEVAASAGAARSPAPVP